MDINDYVNRRYKFKGIFGETQYFTIEKSDDDYFVTIGDSRLMVTNFVNHRKYIYMKCEKGYYYNFYGNSFTITYSNMSYSLEIVEEDV